MNVKTNLKAGLLQGEPVRSSCRKLGSILLLLVIAALPSWAQLGPGNPSRPNDRNFRKQWALENTGSFEGPGGATYYGPANNDIGAVKAWHFSTGSNGKTANVVAVIDTGIDYNHPDLVENVWSAPGEFTVNFHGDSITCPAQSHGFNVLLAKQQLQLGKQLVPDAQVCDPMDHDSYGHGTMVAGVIGAKGNNGQGVAGVNWNARIMGVKIKLNGNSWANVGDVIDAINFVTQAKLAFAATSEANVRVINVSLGFVQGNNPQALWDAEIMKLRSTISSVARWHPDILFVASAGNDGGNNDVVPVYPASFSGLPDTPNVVAVAASDNWDQLMGDLHPTNHGANSVDLAAPGKLVLSTCRTNITLSGTIISIAHTMFTIAVPNGAALYDYFEPGQIIQVYSSTLTTNRGSAKVVAVDPVNKTITVDAVPPGTVATDRIVTSCPANARHGGHYAYGDGTSYAAPQVSGAALLILSACPMDAASLKTLILDRVDYRFLDVRTGGRLNVYNALDSCIYEGLLKWRAREPRFDLLLAGNQYRQRINIDYADSALPGWSLSSYDGWSLITRKGEVVPNVKISVVISKTNPSDRRLTFWDPDINGWAGGANWLQF